MRSKCVQFFLLVHIWKRVLLLLVKTLAPQTIPEMFGRVYFKLRNHFAWRRFAKYFVTYNIFTVESLNSTLYPHTAFKSWVSLSKSKRKLLHGGNWDKSVNKSVIVWTAINTAHIFLVTFNRNPIAFPTVQTKPLTLNAVVDLPLCKYEKISNYKEVQWKLKTKSEGRNDCKSPITERILEILMKNWSSLVQL